MMKPRLLDLFCGAGGAAMGYHRAGFEVVGVDIKPQPHYPFEFHQADALTYPLEGFDAYHASPPCQEYSNSFLIMSRNSPKRYARLLGVVRELMVLTQKPYVIENVMGARYSPMQEEGLQAHYLCGTMFGKQYHRHRLFETSFFWLSPGKCRGKVESGYGTGIKTRRMTLAHERKDIIEAALRQFEIDWMRHNDEIKEAIPPAYTEYIGLQLMKVFDLSEVK